MKAIDVVKPEPKTEVEVWLVAINRLKTCALAKHPGRITITVVSE